MTNEADLMMKMEMFLRRNRPGRPMPGRQEGAAHGCHRPEDGPAHMPGGCYRPEGGPAHMPGGDAMCGGPRHMPMPPHGRPGLSRERVLVLISREEGGVHQKDLLEKAHIGAPAMSELINKLEDDGYIVRTVDPDDRRATLLSLTEKGAARAAEVDDERALRFKAAFANLTDEEKETLSALLDKLLIRQA